MVTIDEMVEHGANLGKLVEVTLFEGAEYNNSWSPGPTIDPQGFDLGEKMTSEPDLKYVGFVSSFRRNRITLAMGSQVELREDRLMDVNPCLYFREETIHSYRVLG